jgi:hypothetical protein
MQAKKPNSTTFGVGGALEVLLLHSKNDACFLRHLFIVMSRPDRESHGIPIRSLHLITSPAASASHRRMSISALSLAHQQVKTSINLVS